ncbi:hypothetical protein JTE90_007335 [Oedothorax gibbosus]|uniref:Nose resistant-to-fluoxetine protein N-terminal domain-containing protein n=1 Tax=Oedothorax gibbosus TaxID=931172 RepID=A0AAV6UQ85_9ARAC|nr:hypothetical protein JTE90_007335 [Oedothorax gibbosus]
MYIQWIILVSHLLLCSLAVCQSNANSTISTTSVLNSTIPAASVLSSTITTASVLNSTILAASVLSTTISTASVLNSTISAETTTVVHYSVHKGYEDMEDYNRKVDNYTKVFEKSIKTFFKNAVKSALPNLLKYNTGGDVMSTKCLSSFLKYVSGLTNVKVWALRMFDATSKPPAGILEGTFSDFGSFDQCLDIEVPKSNGALEFRGAYCAVEARRRMPPMPSNFSMAKQKYAKPLDTIGKELKIAGMAFFYLNIRMGVCVPSLCSLQDMQGIAQKISTIVPMDVTIPQCYVKEENHFRPIHIAVISILSVLFLVCLIGSFVDYQSWKSPEQKLSPLKSALQCFSIPTNFTRLMSSSKGSEELKALHGIRALSMAYIILGHTYVYTNFQLLRGPSLVPKWFNRLSLGVILNGWLSVETFFVLSGLLTSYAVLKILDKTKGKISVSMYILRRYIRLTPALLLTMGLVFFLPLLSSGPFWYERVDPEIDSCTRNWWTSVLYISNWTPLKTICASHTWYLSADFQLYVISIVFIYLLHRSPKLGLSFICAAVIACSTAVGVVTYLKELPPIILISSGNNETIDDTINDVHVRTFTHAGPYYVGVVVGFLILKYKNIKMSMAFCTFGWCCSTVLSLCSLYGSHRWIIGEAHGPLLTSLFAALHRTTFAMSVGWVAFACVTGHGGLVNRFLSSSVFAPLGRLTFLVYLFQSLVIWTKVGSLRERKTFSHYTLLYEFMGHLVCTFLLATPFYLVLEAPLSNLERLLFSRSAGTHKPEVTNGNKSNGHLSDNVLNYANDLESAKKKRELSSNVQLMGVKSLDLVKTSHDIPA